MHDYTVWFLFLVFPADRLSDEKGVSLRSVWCKFRMRYDIGCGKQNELIIACPSRSTSFDYYVWRETLYAEEAWTGYWQVTIPISSGRMSALPVCIHGHIPVHLVRTGHPFIKFQVMLLPGMVLFIGESKENVPEDRYHPLWMKITPAVSKKTGIWLLIRLPKRLHRLSPSLTVILTCATWYGDDNTTRRDVTNPWSCGFTECLARPPSLPGRHNCVLYGNSDAEHVSAWPGRRTCGMSCLPGNWHTERRAY